MYTLNLLERSGAFSLSTRSPSIDRQFHPTCTSALHEIAEATSLLSIDDITYRALVSGEKAGLLALPPPTGSIDERDRQVSG